MEQIPLIFLLLFSVLIMSISIGAIHYHRLTTSLKLSLFQLLIIIAVETIGLRKIVTDPFFLFNIYLVIEIHITSLIGYILIKPEQRYVIIITTTTTLLIFTYHITTKGMSLFATWAFTTASAFNLVIYSVILYQHSNSTDNIIKHPHFWLCITMILYFGCNVPIMSFIDYLKEQRHDNANILYTLVNNSISILRYILLAVSFALCYHKPISKTSNIERQH